MNSGKLSAVTAVFSAVPDNSGKTSQRLETTPGIPALFPT
jgi:hypothetical protein